MLIEGRKINLRLVNLEDAKFILDLRMNEKLNKYISDVDDDLKKQREWLKKYKRRESEEKEYYFIIESKSEEKLGTVRIYDLKSDSFSWGSWIIKDNAPSYASIESVLLIYKFGFYKLGFKNSHFEVRKENDKVVSFHKRFGAEIVNEDNLNFYFQFKKETFENIKRKYKKFL